MILLKKMQSVLRFYIFHLAINIWPVSKHPHLILSVVIWIQLKSKRHRPDYLFPIDVINHATFEQFIGEKPYC